MKKGLLAALLAVTVISAAGCTSEKKAEVPEGGEKINISLTYGPGELGAGEADLDVLFADFYKENPNIKVVQESGGSTMLAKIAVGDAPDIIRCDLPTDIPTYVQKGFAMPLDDYIEKSGRNLDDVYEFCQKIGRYDGKEVGKGSLYALPKDWGIKLMFINKQAFGDAGLEIPDAASFTYMDLYDVIGKLAKVNPDNTVDRYGLTYQEGNFQATLETILEAEGVSFWTEDYKGTTIMTEPKTQKVLKMLLDLQKSYYINSEANKINNGNSLFPVGKTAIDLSGLYASNIYVNNPERTVDFSDMEVYPEPLSTSGTRFCSAAPVGAIISAQSEHPEEAYKVWEYIHFGKLVNERAKTGYNLSILKSAEKPVLETDIQNKAYDMSVEMANNARVLRINPYVASSGVEAVFSKFFTPLIYGQDTWENAMKAIDEEINILIKEGIALINE